MPSITAKRKCPDLIFIRPRFDTYKAISLQIREVFADYTPIIATGHLGGRSQDQHLCTDFDEFQKCADIRMRYLGVATPTSTTVGVTRLAGPDFMIEIEAVAVVNS